ncbi:MAG: chemotaxis protein CheW, partial [Campylobacterota bacterium]|nr:chemotaxis protein CheW [Campylobacterota bacterium]
IKREDRDMIDLIVFSISNNRYALKIENIQRIIQADTLTKIPNAHHFIDGMLSYEDNVIKVLNFRKLIGNQSYSQELEILFAKFKHYHKEWVGELRGSINNNIPFTGIKDVHKCDLGVWLDKFSSYDDEVTDVLTDILKHHKDVHLKSNEVLEFDASQKVLAQEILSKDIEKSFEHTMDALDKFIAISDKVANSLQKFIIYEDDGEIFAIKVDLIEDIAHIKEQDIINANEKNSKNEFLTLQGVLDLKGVLVNVIKRVKLPN